MYKFYGGFMKMLRLFAVMAAMVFGLSHEGLFAMKKDPMAEMVEELKKINLKLDAAEKKAAASEEKAAKFQEELKQAQAWFGLKQPLGALVSLPFRAIAFAAEKCGGSQCVSRLKKRWKVVQKFAGDVCGITYEWFADNGKTILVVTCVATGAVLCYHFYSFLSETDKRAFEANMQFATGLVAQFNARTNEGLNVCRVPNKLEAVLQYHKCSAE